MNNLGRLLREAREDLSREIGREVNEGEVAKWIRERGLPMERKTWSNLEIGRTQTIKPEVANVLPTILPVTVRQIVKALGFTLAFDGIADEEEPEILEAWRDAQDGQRLAVRGALLLPVRQPAGEDGRSLRRQLATGRQDHQGSRE